MMTIATVAVKSGPSLVTRAWKALAPKLIAYLAAGLFTTQQLGVLDVVGVHLDPGLAAMVVAIIAALASYIQRDKLLDLPWNALAPKLLVFILTSITATGLVTFLGYLHVDLHPVVAGLLVTLASAVAGYFVPDNTFSGIDAGTASVTITALEDPGAVPTASTKTPL